MKEKTYSTADLMKAFDLGRNTLRLYEDLGLLVGMSRTDSGYRQFRGQHLEDLKFILRAKEVGFTLNEIKDLLEVTRAEKKMTCGTVSSEIAGKVSEIETQLEVLNAKKHFLTDFLKTCGTKDEDSKCNVIEAGFAKSACCN